MKNASRGVMIFDHVEHNTVTSVGMLSTWVGPYPQLFMPGYVAMVSLARHCYICHRTWPVHLLGFDVVSGPFSDTSY